MNKNGQVFFYTFMLGIVIIILALAFAYPVKQAVDTARNPSSGDFTGLDCANTSISNYDKAACLITDVTTPYFIIGLLAIGGAVIGAKLLFE